MDVPAIQAALLDWYDVHGRQLPWRAAPGDAPDPYGVWVSEVMLQQTRADVVAKRFALWMERFPDVHALAAAPESEVLAAWSGLGYYGRARRLHAAAKIVVDVHGGRLPQDAEDLRCLHGVGPYIAGAVASIAFGQRVAAIDGNVVRIMTRLRDIGQVADLAAGRVRIAKAADRLVPAKRPGDWNQALMDLGARICTPRRPDCPNCPLLAHCEAAANDTVEQRPVLRPKRNPKRERLHVAIVRRGDTVLMQRRDEGLLEGTWLPIGGDIHTPLEDHGAAAGVSLRVGEHVGDVRHVFTHRIWLVAVHAAQCIDEGPLPDGVAWVEPSKVALSTAAAKMLAQVEHAVP